jgi:hypothetical protein
MLTSLDQIIHYNGVIIKYIAGASGEFVGYSLSQSFDQIAKFDNKFTNEQSHYVSDNRVRLHDFFGYSLLTGNACDIDHQLIIDRINWYLSHSSLLDGLHVGVAHPHNKFLNFISKFCKTWKTITITSEHPVSNNFCTLARQQKLKTNGPVPNYKNLFVDTGLDNINIEWYDIVMTPNNHTFHEIEKFLNITGNWAIFEQMRTDYVERNRDLIDQAHKLI